MQPLVRDRIAADLPHCVSALKAVHSACGYPSNWPQDPGTWLTPTGIEWAWVAVDNVERVVGHLVVRQLPGGGIVVGHAELGRFFVAPEAQGCGVGRRLLHEAYCWADALDIALVLEVNDALKPAIALYDRQGWRRTETVLAEWHDASGEPATIHRYVRPRSSSR
jgi:GNAT superfamily N-acetyltransferase